jgi:hypothetical protein
LYSSPFVAILTLRFASKLKIKTISNMFIIGEQRLGGLNIGNREIQ